MGPAHQPTRPPAATTTPIPAGRDPYCTGAFTPTIGPPDVLHVVDELLPEPADGEVRIRIQAFGVNPVEQMMRTGAYPAPFRLPHARLGLEGTGLIDAVGPGVEEFSIGDPVILAAVPNMDINGTYAEYTTLPASAVVARPSGLDVVAAAALWAA